MSDIIITNAQVYTVDTDNPHAEAVVVRGNRIVFVGTTAEALTHRQPHTRMVDGDGRTLIPGFIDSHFHLLWGALSLGDAQLDEVRSLAELEATIRAYELENPGLAWLVGRGLRYIVPSHDEALTRHHLDAIEAERPFLISAYDYHTIWANTAALRLAGLLQGAETPAGSIIVMGEDGLATGELREPGAYDPLLALQPTPDEATQRRLLHRALAWCASLGITSVHNMDGSAEQAALYAALEDAGELTLRVYLPYDVTPTTPLEALATEAVALREQFQSEMVRGGSVKFFMDGVLESYTALLVEPYADDLTTHGEALWTAAQFNSMASEADRLGLQIKVHCCGDGAVRRTLDGFEAAQKANGRRDSRHRVEHIELLHPEDEPRFAELGVIASMQPLHAPMLHREHDVWPSRAGEHRWNRSFAWRKLRDAGARLAFGSDWPVVSPSPFAGLDDALNRRPWGDEGDAHYHQTLAEAIASYTKEAAYAEFQEDVKGQIKVGMVADLVLLSADIFALDPTHIGQVTAAMTICNGQIVFEG